MFYTAALKVGSTFDVVWKLKSMASGTLSDVVFKLGNDLVYRSGVLYSNQYTRLSPRSDITIEATTINPQILEGLL